jgi:hypothetical protein
MLNLIEYSIFIAISFWVLEYVYTKSVLPLFFFPLRVSFPSSPIEHKKRLTARHSIYRYAHLKSALPFVLAALGFLKLHSFSPFLIISFCA